MKDIELQRKITDIRRFFELQLEKYLCVDRVTAPLFVKSGIGINDNLNGIEVPVSFNITNLGCMAEIVHSLAKWKRQALKDYGIPEDYGIYTNMNAIRKDEVLDELHSIYVDQWDWEKVIPQGKRNLDYLKHTVNSIYYALCMTEGYVHHKYKINDKRLPNDISFVYASELWKMYPELSPKEREYKYVMSDPSHYATFIIGIGDTFDDGTKHDGRSPDYDDWQLNGDILVADLENDRVIELSSMGIRVDKDSLVYQCNKLGCENRLEYDFHKKILNSELPQSIGGGIGQSRLCMYLLNIKHIKDVQESIWE